MVSWLYYIAQPPSSITIPCRLLVQCISSYPLCLETFSSVRKLRTPNVAGAVNHLTPQTVLTLVNIKFLLSKITKASGLQVFACKRYSYFTLLLPNYNYGSHQHKTYLSLPIKCPIFLSVFKLSYCAPFDPPNLLHTN
jgi:hypothetical protein